MYSTHFRSCCAFASSLLLCANSFGASAIGQISAKGNVHVDNVATSQTATLFEGSRIKTSKAASELTLAGGGHYLLASDSGAQIFEDRLVLERGTAQVRGANAAVSAAGLSFRPSPQGGGRLTLLADNRIVAEALSAPAKIYKGGIVIASLRAGSSLQLSNPSGANQSTRITGLLYKKHGKYFLQDEATQTVFEVRGNVARHDGKRVELKGEISTEKPAPGATHVLQISEARRVGAAAGVGAAGAGAGRAGAAGAAGAGSHTAMIVGVTVLTAAGVGLGVGLTQSEERETVSR